jgi:hypothetical protein
LLSVDDVDDGWWWMLDQPWGTWERRLLDDDDDDDDDDDGCCYCPLPPPPIVVVIPSTNLSILSTIPSSSKLERSTIRLSILFIFRTPLTSFLLSDPTALSSLWWCSSFLECVIEVVDLF